MTIQVTNFPSMAGKSAVVQFSKEKELEAATALCKKTIEGLGQTCGTTMTIMPVDNDRGVLDYGFVCIKYQGA